MSKANRLSQNLDAFTNEAGGSSAPFSSFDDDLFEALETAVDGTPLINVYEIHPDHRQPRRVMPASIRRLAIASDAHNLGKALDAWHKQVEERLGREVEVAALISQVDENEALESDDPFVANYRELISLATSIHNDGLINPIHVVKMIDSPSSHYLIESGERRWLAYVLLNHISPGGNYGKIKAEIQDALSVWRQASENTARRALNAIGMARQYALLVMDLLREQGETFESYERMLDGDSDLAFYAQVADARIPYGQSQKVYDGLNISSRVSVNRYKALLTIDPELWVEADETDMSLRQILETIGKISPTPPAPKKDEMLHAWNNSGGQPSNVLSYPSSGHGSQMPHAVDNPPRRDAGNPFGDAGRMSVPVNRRADRVPPAVPTGEYAHSTQPEAGALADVARPLPSAEAYVRDRHIWKQLAHLLALSGQVKGAKALEDLLKIDRASFAGWVEDGEQEVQQMLIRYHGELIDGINGMIESKILPAIMEMLQDANYRDEE